MRSTPVLIMAVLCCGATAVVAQTGPGGNELAARVRALEDREAIRTLWADYGRTLDARDFVAFSQLFPKDAEFVGGPGSPAKGPAAIGAFLEKAIGTNYPNSKGRNFHLYFNESIDLRGDEGTGLSKGGFVMVSSDNSKADFLLLATYRDQFVREDGRWKFKRREVIGDIPVPRSPAR
jgi:SnoaL-like domain